MFSISNKKFWIGLFVFHFILRMPTLWTAILNIDETQFLLYAHTLLDGGLPYVDSVDTKPLGMYYYFVTSVLLFGRYSMFGVHLLTIFWTFITPCFLYKILKLYGNKKWARLAAVLFVIFSVSYLPEFLAVSIASIMTPLLVLSVYFVMKSHFHICEIGFHKKVLGWDFIGGLVLGFAFLFKYQAGIQTVHFFVLTLFVLWKRRQLAEFFIRNAIFGVAFILPFILHGFYLYRIGVFSDFLMWTQANKQYIAFGMSTSSFLKRAVIRVGAFALSTLALWYLAGKAGVFKWPQQKFKDLRTANLAWFVLSFIAISVGGRYYPHYFIQILPALCTLGAMAYFVLKKWQKQFVVGFSVVSILVFLSLRFDHRLFFKYFPDDELYQQETIGLKLRKISKPDDELFVWGFATAIYYYAEVKPASRFLWCDWLVARPLEKNSEPQRLSQNMQDYLAQNWELFWQDMKKSKPRFFVDTSIADYHMYENFPISRYPKLKKYIDTHYKKTAEVEGVYIYERKS